MTDKPKILVVDDSISIVNSLQSILSISGYNVDSAFNGSDALRKIHNQEYDLVICDIEMPGLSGLDFLSRVRKDFDNSLDVILMTGYLEHDYFLEAIRLGASDFIRKPIDTKGMINSIQELIFRKRKKTEMVGLYSRFKKLGFFYEIPADEFPQVEITKLLNHYLRNRFKVDAKIVNELLVCIDEMVYNAYIHGTLGLNSRERNFSHHQMQELTMQKLENPKIRDKIIRVSMQLDNNDESISVEVEDQGQGFDHQKWAEKALKQKPQDLNEHGRGLAVLYHLCDEVSFEKGGRLVKIKKSIRKAAKNAP